MSNFLFVLQRILRRPRRSELGDLLAPLLQEAVAGLRKRNIPPEQYTVVVEGKTRVSQRIGWWLDLGGATPRRYGMALWIDQDARHWDDSAYAPFWHPQSTRNPARPPQWTLGSYGHRAGDHRPPAFTVTVDHRVEGGLVVTPLDGNHDEVARRSFRDLIAYGVAKAQDDYSQQR